jgi:hypothetical protein
MDVALGAGISTKHLSFVETGRARPSREMVIRLTDQMNVPLRDRNEMLLAAGFAPVYGQRSLDDPEMGPVRDALQLVLQAHRPYPAVVVDRHWNVIARTGTQLLLGQVAPELLSSLPQLLSVTRR